MFHFDHPRAHVGGEHRAVGTGEDSRQIQDGDPGERRAGHRDSRCRCATVTRSDTQRVRRLFQSAVALGDHDAAERPGVELERVPLAIKHRERVVGRQFFEPDAHHRVSSTSGTGGHELQAAPGCTCCPRPICAPGPDPFALHAQRCRGRRQPHVRECGRLGRRVPPVHVERGVGLRDSRGLHASQRGVERLALLESSQDVVRGAVHDTAKPSDRDARHCLAHQVEDRDAVHDGTFKEERHARRGRL